MPVQASQHAVAYDALFFTITGLTVVFTVLVLALVAKMVFTYRAGKVADRRNPIDHSSKLEALWTIIPLVLALGIFVWSASNFIHVRKEPKNATEIFVIGKQWMWHVQHMNGVRENNELTIPVGRPIKLTMISQDVIHAMYIPEFRAQYHVVPGRYTSLYFTPTKVGEYKMLCAMHCGTQHTEMVGKVHVLSEEDFAKWEANQGNRFRPMAKTMAEAGALVWKEKGCANCHAGQDNERAPTLVGIFGKERTFTDGTKAVATDEYLRESIVLPWNRLTAGYGPTMNAYRGQLTEEQVLQLIAFIKTDGKVAVPTTEPRVDEKTGQRLPNAAEQANELESAGKTQFRQWEQQRR
jgi:cytochrome c oxidase subunit 2